MRLVKYIQLLLLSLLCGNVSGANLFVSPKGNNMNTGNSKNSPLADIEEAVERISFGDTIFLMPGFYHQKTQISEKHGQPDRNIVIRSLATDPTQFSIIDIQRKFMDTLGEAFIIKNSSWITIENIIFRNAWPTVIDIFDSQYITISNCHLQSGKRVICPQGHGSHHILVQNCFIEHPIEVWNKWSWAEIHHGVYNSFNGGLLHPKESGGGHVVRDNTLVNLFNGIRTRPKNITEDGNMEIYNNTLINIRDNDFEPESWAWNIHYYYNQHINIHKVYSIDNVQGGNIYIYGNTYTQSKDDWALKEVSGIFKYSMGPITYPCYAFNNSYYTAAKVLRKGESTNHHLKHFNNAYYFFEGDKRFQLIEWQLGYEFDYDCINHDWPTNIYKNGQELNGLKNTDAKFIRAEMSDFRLADHSACIDGGKVMELPEFDWVQDFIGDAPDIGAFEDENYVDGPAFRFIPSPSGSHYKERPRISRHGVNGKELILHFSAALDTENNLEHSIRIFQNGDQVPIESANLGNNGYTLTLATERQLRMNQLSILFDEKPIGVNGLPLTEWASTITIGEEIVQQPDLSSIEGISNQERINELLNKPQIAITNQAHRKELILEVHHLGEMSKGKERKIEILDVEGAIIKSIILEEGNKLKLIGFLDRTTIPSGIYFARMSFNNQRCDNLFVLHN